MHLLLVSPAESVDDVLPGLALLAAHRTTLTAVTTAGLAAAPHGVDAVLLDGRTRPRAARELAHTLRRTRGGVPRLLVLGTDADLPADAEGDVDGLLLADAGPAEIDLRLRLAAGPARPRPAAAGRAPAAPESGALGVGDLVVGDLVVDPASFSARVADRPLPLARREFELLSELVEHAGRPLSRRHLLATVWGPDYEGSARTVDVHVKQLRRVLGAAHRDMIRTVRGTGYVLVAGSVSRPVRVGVAPPLLARPTSGYGPVHRVARLGGRDAPGDVVASTRDGDGGGPLASERRAPSVG